jgi:hypothetical protein
MTNEEFLKDICPNHTDKSKWNKSELLHILDKYQALQLQQTGVSGSDYNKFGKKTKTKKGKTDCDDCKFKDGHNDNACFSCPDEIGFGNHYR